MTTNTTQHNADTASDSIARHVVPRSDYVDWLRESSDEEIRAGKELDHERWLGKKIAKTAIAEYNKTWKDHAWQEVTTRQSQRRFASKLADDSAPSLG